MRLRDLGAVFIPGPFRERTGDDLGGPRGTAMCPFGWLPIA